MPQLPEPLERLIQELSRLPGIGPKTAQRLAFHLLRSDSQRASSLAHAIEDVKARIGYCERCYNIAEGSLCAICASARRDATLLCVVESPLDLLAIERTAEFSGLYFVLQGVISPIDGIGPEQLHVPQLLDRVREEGVAEVIIATDADIEGEATALYLQRALQALGPRVTRPAHGLPVGGDLEYADELTLARAMAGRRAFWVASPGLSARPALLFDLAAQRAGALGVGLLSGGYGQDELERAGAHRVYEDPADLLAHLDELGIRAGV